MNNLQEVLIYCAVHGYDKGETEKFTREWLLAREASTTELVEDKLEGPVSEEILSLEDDE